MESPRKFNDCYFYYYSTCTKGDNCVFRHEPSALGCETMCTAWQQGKCLDKRCKLRHMELRKNRKQIPCYWENQPGGCRKKHCPFMHKNPEARTDGIAPSQPAPNMPPMGVNNVPEGVCPEQPMSNNVGAPPVPAPAPMPLLWQQQRQVVLDSAILGVVPGVASVASVTGAGGEILGARRVVAGHHEAPAPYAPMPVDSLVVNFEEESDNESAPSSTPTKTPPDDEQKIARSKSQELLLLEKIQAEAAAFYSYDSLPVDTSKERKNRTNLSTKYDRLSLDEIAGKKPNSERRNSLDFKILSLEEIRARKKAETIIHSTPITLNLNRKRKLSSTQETVSAAGNKIIKVVSSNSIVYKKVDKAPAVSQNKVGNKQNETESRKRTLSEVSDIYDNHENELIDNCYEFKRIKLGEQTSKPKLIRNRTVKIQNIEDKIDTRTDNDSDTEVQIVSVEIPDRSTNIDLSDSEIIYVESTKIDPIVVDLSDDEDELDLSKNIPDVVASCHKKDTGERDLLKDIDDILDDSDVNTVDDL